MGKALAKQALEEAEADEKITDISGVPETRKKAVVRLKLAGATFQQIAEVEGFASAHIARKVMEEALAATVDELKDVPYLRALHTARLERLLTATSARAMDNKDAEQLAFTRTSLSLIDRLIKLQGADAPQRLEVYTPGQQAREEWLRRAVAAVSPGDLEEEEDIIDAEVVDDDES